VKTTKNKDQLQKVKYSFLKILTGSDLSRRAGYGFRRLLKLETQQIIAMLYI